MGYKKFCKKLFQIGAAGTMTQKEGEIRNTIQPQDTATGGNITDESPLLRVSYSLYS